MAAYLNPQTWDTWLDHQVLENSLTTAGLPRPIQLRIIYAEPNPEDGRALLYGFPRQDLPCRPTVELIRLTPVPYRPTGTYVIAFLEYTFEKPEPDKPWQDETRYPGGIVMIGYLLP